MPRIVPKDRPEITVSDEEREVHLTNLQKPFWPELGITKGDLLDYYSQVARWLVPHVRDRAMVMRRYPDGAHGKSFFMKRAPSPRPDWIEICTIDHGSAGIIDFPMVQDLLSLLWVVNLGCIDLNPWYARCDDVDRPDFLQFDLDPGSASFARVREAALILRDALDELQMPSLVKTTGSKGLHIYIPIVRGPTQREVWAVSKALAQLLAKQHPALMTSEYKVKARPAGRVLVDYNQNAWGRTLASIYSVRPSPRAGVSMPVTWSEVERGVEIDDFRIDNAVARLEKRGDLWASLLSDAGRFNLRQLSAR